ncbi:hypothetical protein DSO57_1017598 [Entomophthora muscae]|uniref:Uncharacterized protein n=1 Tax=Entomophthora muscae TaxID=34485 RepID=A0ACC2RJ72_9FUNG|nr:hypothetical protein DSO57_1017598 [Entomophthora muscae]
MGSLSEDAQLWDETVAMSDGLDLVPNPGNELYPSLTNGITSCHLESSLAGSSSVLIMAILDHSHL